MVLDVTGVELTPGNGGKDCAGNGMRADVGCCCDECDYAQCCAETPQCAACEDTRCPRKV